MKASSPRTEGHGASDCSFLNANGYYHSHLGTGPIVRISMQGKRFFLPIEIISRSHEWIADIRNPTEEEQGCSGVRLSDSHTLPASPPCGSAGSSSLSDIISGTNGPSGNPPMILSYCSEGQKGIPSVPELTYPAVQISPINIIRLLHLKIARRRRHGRAEP